MSNCEEAIDRIVMGPEKKKRILSKQDKEVFAYHEAGHAVVACLMPLADHVHKVTIVGRGLAGGYTMMLPNEPRFMLTRSKLKQDLMDILGGRAAEVIACGEPSTGAYNDL